MAARFWNGNAGALADLTYKKNLKNLKPNPITIDLNQPIMVQGFPFPCGKPSDDCPYAPGLIAELPEYFCPKCKHVFGPQIINQRTH